MNRKIIIGDIHGCFDELLELLEKTKYTEKDTVISLGDLVDRGPFPVKTVNLFKNSDNFKCVLGNHERKHLHGLLSPSQKITKSKFGDTYHEFISWISELPCCLEYEDVILIHGYLDPEIPLVSQQDNILCGSSSGYNILYNKYGKTPWYELYNGSRPVIFGHHIVGSKPFIYNNIVFGIDTGACHGGYLTALILPEFEFISVKSKRNYWSEEKRAYKERNFKVKTLDKLTLEEIDLMLENYYFSNIENNKEYYSKIKIWQNDLSNILNKIIIKIKVDYINISDSDNSNFNKKVKSYPVPELLYMQKARKLSLNRLKRIYKTPISVLDLAKSLGLEFRNPNNETCN